MRSTTLPIWFGPLSACRFLFKFTLVVAILCGLVLLAGLFIEGFKKSFPGLNAASQPVPLAPADLHVHLERAARPGLKTGETIGSPPLAALLQLVGRAEDVLVLNLQLATVPATPLAAEQLKTLSTAILRRRAARPNLMVLVISDAAAPPPGPAPPALAPLLHAGCHVLVTDLGRLPARHRLGGAAAATFGACWAKLRGADKAAGGKAPEQGPRRPANNRHLAMARDAGGDWQALLFSGNPAAEANCAALQLRRGPFSTMLNAELEIARVSLLQSPPLLWSLTPAPDVLREVERLFATPPPAAMPVMVPGVIRLEYLTERAIADKLEWMLDGVRRDDALDIVIPALSAPAVLDKLRAAAARGARLRLLLDPGPEPSGWRGLSIPTRTAARRLAEFASAGSHDIRIRWLRRQWIPSGLRFLRIYHPATGREQLLAGTADFTAGALQGHRLEAAVFLENAVAAGHDFDRFFLDMWENRNGQEYSVNLETHAGSGWRQELRRKLSALLDVFNLGVH